MALPEKTLKKLKKKMFNKQLLKYLMNKHGYSKEEAQKEVERTYS